MDALIQQLLTTWRVNNRIDLQLIAAIPAKGLAAVPLASRGRTVARQFVHRGSPAFAPKAEPGKRELLRAFRASGKAVEQYLKERLNSGRRIKYFKGQPVRWLAYMIAHESHHRGSIMLALKQNGRKMPKKVALGAVWYNWYFGKD
jgi:uncharacterized damage-inducible protein DinB